MGLRPRETAWTAPVVVRLDKETLKVCIEAAKGAGASNAPEEAGRAKVVAALEALLKS